MAKSKIKIKNGNGGLFWAVRPASKMNNKMLDDLGQNIKKFTKRYSSKKRRVFLKTEVLS